MVDDFTRECVQLIGDTSISGARVARELNMTILERLAKPETVVSDNGTYKYGDPALVKRP